MPMEVMVHLRRFDLDSSGARRSCLDVYCSPPFSAVFLMQNEAGILLKFILHYESFASIGGLRLRITNSLCTPLVLFDDSSTSAEQKCEKTCF